MAKLIYAAIASLDGYVEDEEGRFDWSAPDEEVHAFVNDLERPIGTYLYGRRMYETMVFWETVTPGAMSRQCFRTPLGSGRRQRRSCTPGRLRRYPVRGRGSSMSSTPTPSGGSSSPRARHRSWGCRLAGQAIGAGLVDECHLFLVPDGGGRRKPPCQATSARNSSFSMNAGSETASFTSTTA